MSTFFRRLFRPRLHVDGVQNNWGGAQQERLYTIKERRGQPLPTSTGSSYFFLTDPHTKADCPFKNGDIVPMVVTSANPQELPE